MAISIDDLGCTDNTHQSYFVTIDDEYVNTIVTHVPLVVQDWIEDIEYIHRFRINRGKMVVGLDVEWRPQMQPNTPRNPVAVIQLCVGHRCLIFQVLRSDGVPLSLLEFLRNEDFTFVGVGIAGDVNKLWEDYELDVSNIVDLRFLAADETESRWMRNAGLAALSRAVLGKEIHKPRSVTMSDWSRARLTKEQVQYACVDAFSSFELGRVLRAYSNKTLGKMMRSNEQVTRKRTRGRQKIPIEKIKCPSARQVTFSKRREGLFRKASELAVLCGAEFAIIAISGGSKVYSFGNPDAGTVINHYLTKRKVIHDNHSIVYEEAIGSYVRAVEELEAEKRKLAAGKGGGGGKGFEEWEEEKIEEMSLEEMEEYLTWLECLRAEIVEKIGEPSA